MLTPGSGDWFVGGLVTYHIVLLEQRPGDELKERQQVAQTFLLQPEQTQHLTQLLALDATFLQMLMLNLGAIWWHELLVNLMSTKQSTFGFWCRAPHLARRLQLLGPLHHPELCFLVSALVFVFFVMTHRCPWCVLQTLRT